MDIGAVPVGGLWEKFPVRWNCAWNRQVVGEGELWYRNAACAVSPWLSPASSAVSPAAYTLLPQCQTKKGAVSNCFISILYCQRGLNSSLWSSDSAAKGGQRRTEAKQ